MVFKNPRTAWLYQSSSVRDIFTEIVPELYTTYNGSEAKGGGPGVEGKGLRRRGKGEKHHISERKNLKQEIRSVEHGICPIAEFTSPY